MLIPPEHIGRFSIATVLDPAVEQMPDATFLIAVDGRLTYAEFDDAINRAANALIELGVAPGERVAFSLPNTLAAGVSLFATARAGAVWVGLNPHLAGPEKAHMLGDSDACVLVADAPSIEQITQAEASLSDLRAMVSTERSSPRNWTDLVAASSAHRPGVAVSPTDLAAFGYTSGTTGFPKGATHIHRSLLLQGSVVAATRGFTPTTRYGLATPLTNLMGQMLSVLTMPQAGGSVVLIDRMHAERVAAWVHAEQITDMPAVVALIHDLVTNPNVSPSALQSLRHVVAGAGDVPPNIIERFEAATGIVVDAGYGQTEIPGAATMSRREGGSILRTSGPPLPHVELAILDEAGNEAASGIEGEICVRAARSGAWAMLYRPLVEYWKHPDETARALRGGYLHTGDVGFLDSDGELVVTGRMSAMIVRGGANIYPAEVERVLLDAPGVGAAIVVGLPDPRLGQIVVAVVEPRAGEKFDSADCIEFCRRSLAGYKCPEAIVAVEHLARNSLGKIIITDALALATNALERPLRHAAD